MARFTFAPGFGHKDLGERIFTISKEVNGDPDSLADARRPAHRNLVQEVVSDEDKDKIVLHYDTEKVINIVVPYLGEGGSYDDNEFANEAMGMGVVRGCAS